MRFEDVHPYAGNTYYVAPNEEPLILRDLLKSTYIGRAAGICSGGEVGFFSMLPLVRRELVLVDHSYRSMAFAMLKYLLIRDRGWKDTLELLSKHERALELTATVALLKEQLPESVRVAFERLESRRDASFVSVYNHPASARLHSDLVAAWGPTPPRLVRKTAKKLDKISFLHGDLQDLIARGPFDVLYISNALEHYDRDSKSPLLTNIEKIVKPGGFIASTAHYSAGARWKTIEEIRGRRWTYVLYQVKTPEELAAA